MPGYYDVDPWTVGFVTAVPLFLYLTRRWCQGTDCHSDRRLDGQTVVITGANAGIGKETAIDLAKRGATVVMACRDVKRGALALQEVQEKSKSTRVFLKILDLSSLKSVREFSSMFISEFKQLHVLVNNAGIGACPYGKTEDGFEIQFGVNHLGHFALTNLLLPCMMESTPPARIVNVSSKASQITWLARINFDDINSEKSYSPFGAYCQSKLANVLFTKELNEKLLRSGCGVTTYSVHPGTVLTEIIYKYHNIVATSILKLIGNAFFKTPCQGAQTSVYCAVQEGIEHLSGRYFEDCGVKSTSKMSNDQGLAEKLWELSELMTNVKCPL